MLQAFQECSRPWRLVPILTKIRAIYLSIFYLSTFQMLPLLALLVGLAATRIVGQAVSRMCVCVCCIYACVCVCARVGGVYVWKNACTCVQTFVYFVWYVYMNGCTHKCMHVNCREISQTQARTSPLRYATNKGSFLRLY